MSPLTRRRGKHYEAYRLEARQGGLGLLLIAVVLQRPVKGSPRLASPPPLRPRLLPIRRLHPFRVLVVACHYIQNSNRISIQAAAKLNRVDFASLWRKCLAKKTERVTRRISDRVGTDSSAAAARVNRKARAEALLPRPQGGFLAEKEKPR